MGFRLTCDSCEFGGAVDDEPAAFTDARDHEAAHPEHFVYITERQR